MYLNISMLLLLAATVALVNSLNVTTTANPKSMISVKMQVRFENYGATLDISQMAVNGTNAFDLLQMASQRHPCFNFEYKVFPSLGRYISSICCVAQNTTTQQYWLIYINDKSSPVGVDQLQPKTGDTLQFIYRQLSSGHNQSELDENMNKTTNETRNVTIPQNTASVQLTFTNYPPGNSLPIQKIALRENMTAFELLEEASKLHPCYDFEYTQFSIGRFINTICCVSGNSSTGFYWFLYINGKQSPVGVDLLKPKNGDTITFKYEVYKPTEQPAKIAVFDNCVDYFRHKCRNDSSQQTNVIKDRSNAGYSNTNANSICFANRMACTGEGWTYVGEANIGYESAQWTAKRGDQMTFNSQFWSANVSEVCILSADFQIRFPVKAPSLRSLFFEKSNLNLSARMFVESVNNSNVNISGANFTTGCYEVGFNVGMKSQSNKTFRARFGVVHAPTNKGCENISPILAIGIGLDVNKDNGTYYGVYAFPEAKRPQGYTKSIPKLFVRNYI